MIPAAACAAYQEQGTRQREKQETMIFWEVGAAYPTNEYSINGYIAVTIYIVPLINSDCPHHTTPC